MPRPKPRPRASRWVTTSTTTRRIDDSLWIGEARGRTAPGHRVACVQTFIDTENRYRVRNRPGSGRGDTLRAEATLVDLPVPFGIDQQHRAGAGAIVVAADEGRAQPALAFQSDAGVGQVAVGGAMFVRQGGAGQVLIAGLEPGFKRGHQSSGLRPGCVQRAVGHAMRPGPGAGARQGGCPGTPGCRHRPATD